MADDFFVLGVQALSFPGKKMLKNSESVVAQRKEDLELWLEGVLTAGVAVPKPVEAGSRRSAESRLFEFLTVTTPAG